jgi:hypothetical protein
VSATYQDQIRGVLADSKKAVALGFKGYLGVSPPLTNGTANF